MGSGWKRFVAWLTKNEPGSLSLWSEAIYAEWWGDGKCEACGAGLAEWQIGGHRMDRIDNSRPHIPANCRRLCWPCNCTKADKNPEVFRSEVGNWVAAYGRGRVPWAALNPRFKPAALPNVAQFRVEVQGRLFDEDPDGGRA